MAKHILIVEDDPFIAEIYVDKLNNAGFEAKAVADGEQALEAIKTQQPELILLDIILPGMDGWQVLNKLNDEQLLKKIKVILLSNLEQRHDVERQAKLAIKYLIKAHYTPSQVVEEIKKVLNSNR